MTHDLFYRKARTRSHSAKRSPTVHNNNFRPSQFSMYSASHNKEGAAFLSPTSERHGGADYQEAEAEAEAEAEVERGKGGGGVAKLPWIHPTVAGVIRWLSASYRGKAVEVA